MSGPHGESPREAVRELVRQLGEDVLVAKCCEILDAGDVDGDVLVGLSGEHAREILRGREGGVEGYWPRVWALRALLYAWNDSAESSVGRALDDEAWRVREMALKVVRRRAITAAVPRVATLRLDPVQRVRDAAERALTVIGGSQEL